MKGILIQDGTPTPDKPVEIKTITIPLNKVSYEDLEALTIEQQTQLFAKDKEIERLHSIIKEVREYIKKNCILSDEWTDLDFCNFIPTGKITYKQLTSKKVKRLLEILDKVDKDV